MNILNVREEELMSALKSAAFKTTVVGVGTVGSYIVAEFLNAGGRVIGADIRREVVDAINERKEGVFDPEIREIFHNKVSEGKLTATTDVAAAVADSKVICISVPTLLDKNGHPDLSILKSAVNTVSKGLRRGSIVMLSSSVSIGTTRNVVLPILQESGLAVGDFCLAFTPERMNPGVPLSKLAKIPRLVSGIDEASKNLAAAIIRTFAQEVVPVNSVELAEATKLYENTFRDVNIALVNDLAIYFNRLGLDALDVIRAASTKWNVLAHYPGIGVGGYCIPVSPRYLAEGAVADELRIVKVAREINDNMPKYVINLIAQIFSQMDRSVQKAKIAVLGLAYKENVPDLRWSPSSQIIERLSQLGAELSLHDPHASNEDVKNMYGLPNLPLEEALKDSDCMVVVTGHEEFKKFSFEKIKTLMKSRAVVIDGRNILNSADAVTNGLIYAGVGRTIRNPIMTQVVS